MLEDRRTTKELDARAVVVDERMSLCDSNLNRQAGHWTADKSFKPRVAIGQVTEARHRTMKAGYTSLLREKADTIEALDARVRALEKSERHLKARLFEKTESLKDSEANLQAAQIQASILEERIDSEMVAREDMRVMLERYRSWWLNEYYSLGVVVQMIAEPDDGVTAMRESSCARYHLHLASEAHFF